MENNDKTILIVEDEQTLGRALTAKLESVGFSVLCAHNGEEGLAVAQEKMPDLILADIIMPKMDGLTMLDKMRENEWGKNVPVIMLTNLSSAEDIDEATKNGVHDYLVKSDWTLEDIVAKVKEELQIK
jgi:DNA-binding response OmpR family regulator